MNEPRVLFNNIRTQTNTNTHMHDTPAEEMYDPKIMEKRNMKKNLSLKTYGICSTSKMG